MHKYALFIDELNVLKLMNFMNEVIAAFCLEKNLNIVM